MQELIKITERNGQKVVSARDLHTYLDATERFSNWIERQFQYGFIENTDYVGCKVFNTLAKQELDDFALTIDCAKEISMLQKNDKGKQARLYFIECEKQLLKPKELSRIEILQIALEAEKKNIELQKQIEEQKPKVEFYDDIANTTDSFDMKEVSAMLKLEYGRNKLFQKLRDIKILMSDNLPYRKFIDNGCFIVVESKWNNAKTLDVNAVFQTRVTQKGIEMLNKTLPKKLKL